MDHPNALAILKILSEGNDPETGKAFPPDSPYQRPGVIRALFHAVGVLESASPVGAQPASEAHRCNPGAGALLESAAATLLASAVPSPRRGAAPRSGKPWTTEEDEKLVAGFDAGQTLAALAADHGRSRIAIEARLAKFDKVPMPAGVRSRQSPHASDVDRALYASQA